MNSDLSKILSRFHVLRVGRFPDSVPVALTVVGPAGDDQPIAVTAGQDLAERGNEVLKSFVRSDLMPKKVWFLFYLLECPVVAWPRFEVRFVFGTASLIPERDDGNPRRSVRQSSR